MPLKEKLLFLFAIIILCTSGNLSAQGLLDGFMRGKGQIVTALSYSHESFDTYFVGTNNIQNENLGTINTNSINFFAAAGLTDYLDVVVSLPYITARATQGFWSDQKDFQDISLFLKGRILETNFSKNDNLSIIGAMGVIAPLSDYIADAPVSIGNQSTQLEGRFIAQYRTSFGIFVTSQFGYSKRGNVVIDRGLEVSVPDAFDYILRAGGSYKKLYADAWFQHQNSRSGTNIGSGVPFPSNEIDFSRIGFTLYHPIPKIVNLGVALSTGFTLSGRNIGKSDRITASLVYNFSVFKP
ncbi:hypothetical protein [Cellulophaga sp. Hel_I_12]|uniref:hypothetical protein n=1 Tax=Cellulophaga sp. Hel_I_12 TaxID=1249972 RepID=UPI000A3FB57D|nr:hypothetical protein [Cellulophaga sp. Hel_I_12]